MQSFSGREKALLSALVILAFLVLLGAWLPVPLLTTLLGEPAVPVIEALHQSPFADVTGLVGAFVALITLVLPALQREAPPPPPPPPVPAPPPPPTPPNPRIALSRFAFRHQAEAFLGRDAELALLDRAWTEGFPVLSLVAWGGVGKTALVAEWLRTRFMDRGWRDRDGAPLAAYFDWSFYDQGTARDDQATRVGSVGDFFEQALAHFGDPDPRRPDKGRRLAGLIQQQRALVILDGLEPLQQPIGHPQAGQLLDPDLRDLTLALAQRNPGLLLLTSRQALPDLSGHHQHPLDELSRDTAIRLLRQMQVTGSDADLDAACEEFDCHALSLTLLGRFLIDAHGGDIRRRDRVQLIPADRQTRADRRRTAWKVLAAYEDWLAPPASGWWARLTRRAHPADARGATLAVLRLTGLFDRPASAGCLDALRRPPVIPGLTDPLVGLDTAGWHALLRRMQDAQLIRLRPDPQGDAGDALDAHPLIREYFAEQLRRHLPKAHQAAHGRLFDYLCESTRHRPDDLPGLQPLYQAVRHGVLAGRAQEARKQVYVERILRGTGADGFYSTRKLGAIGQDLGAVAAFFEEPWTRRPSPRPTGPGCWP